MVDTGKLLQNSSYDILSGNFRKAADPVNGMEKEWKES